MKAFNHSDEWRERFLNMLELYGDFPNKYPFKAWKSRLTSDSVSLDMLEGWMTASLIYTGTIQQEQDGKLRHTQKAHGGVMQHYLCTNCREDAFGGKSIVWDGMFLKICKNCAEDEEIYSEFERRLMEETCEIVDGTFQESVLPKGDG